MSRSPHASYLNPKWGVDINWMLSIGVTESVHSGGQLLIEEHTPTIKEPEPQQLKSKPATVVVRRSLPCINLGSRVEKGCSSCWRKSFHNCELLETTCRPAVECQTCSNYVADTPEAAK